MNILHINCDYLGSNAVHRTMMEEFQKNKSIRNRITVVVPTCGETKTPKNIVAINVIKKTDKLLYFHKQNKIYKNLLSKININNYQCVHAFTLFTDGNIAYRINKNFNLPYIVAVRSTDINTFLKLKPYLKNRAKRILKNASKIIFLSKTHKRQLEKILYRKNGYPHNQKTLIIPNGVDNFWIKNIQQKKLNIDSKKIIKAIYVGKINKRKNVSRLVDLIEKTNNIQLTIIGKIEDSTILKENQRIKHLGQQSKELIIKYLRDSDIFIMPSLHETFGLVYVEAMSQGLPVIYTKGQGFDEQFAEGVVGYHVDPNSTESIIEAIKKITLNYSSISKNCAYYTKNFSWGKICLMYNSIYKEIVQEYSNSNAKNK